MTDPEKLNPAECPDPEVGRLLAMYDSGRCSKRERVRFAAHLLICSECRELEALTRGSWGGVIEKYGLRRRISLFIPLTAAAVLVAFVALWGAGAFRTQAREAEPFDPRSSVETTAEIERALSRVEVALRERRTRSLLAYYGENLRRLERFEEAEGALQEALTAPEEEPKPEWAWKKGAVQSSLALVLLAQGDLHAATQLIEETVFEEEDAALWNKAHVFSQAAAQAYFKEGDALLGAEYLRRARELDERYQAVAKPGQPRSSYYLQVAFQVAVYVEGDPESAVAIARELVAFGVAHDTWRGEPGALEANGLDYLGAALCLRFDVTGAPEHLREAQEKLARALELRKRNRSYLGQVRALTNLGIVALRREDAAIAKKHLSEAREMAVAHLGGEAPSLPALPALGIAHLRLDELASAKEVLARAEELAQSRNLPRYEALALEGQILAARQEMDPGVRKLEMRLAELLPGLTERYLADRLSKVLDGEITQAAQVNPRPWLPQP